MRLTTASKASGSSCRYDKSKYTHMQLRPQATNPGTIRSSATARSIRSISLRIRRADQLVAADGQDGALSSFSDSDESIVMSPAAVAYTNGTLGVGFSAGGLLFPYYLGITSELGEMGILTKDTLVAGASAGSLIAACSKSGLTAATLKDALVLLAKECRRRGTRHNLGPILQSILQDVLPQDIHERCNQQGVQIAVTHVFPQPKPVLLNSYLSRNDLIQALLTSCHIPWYLDGRLTTSFRGVVACDGGLTNFLPAPAGATHTVRVCCFPAKQIKGAFGQLSIAPDLGPEPWPHDMRTMLSWAFEPAPEDMLLSLIDKGARDARTWAVREGVAQVAAARMAQQSVSAAAGQQLLL